MTYLLGVDGGGTKTEIHAVSKDGSDIRKTIIGGASWREHGVDTVVRAIHDAVAALVGPARVAGVAIGLPCYGESAEGDAQLEKAVKEIFAPAPVYLTNDVEVGWAGSLALQPGINVVAGTGSIAFGKDFYGNTARSGGWDDFYGDEGSCHWVARKMMETFSKQADGRIPKGALHGIVRKAFGLSDDLAFIDHIRKNYLDSRKDVAGLQVLAEQAALAGDASAMAIYKQAAEELFLLTQGVRAQLRFPEMDWVVSYSGGLFKSGKLILEPFAEFVSRDGGTLQPPAHTPAEGAVLLAFQRFK
jgi:N-acetylglucosamine kinase-like BadF-type ATPase